MTLSRRKSIRLLVALALVATLIVGATLAFLTASTDEITNVFTVGNITAELTEINDDSERVTSTTEGGVTTYTFHMFPGDTFRKQPVLTIGAGSVDSYAYLYVTGLDALLGLTYAYGTGSLPLWEIFHGNDLGEAALIGGLNTENWTLVQATVTGGLDGLYRYDGVVQGDLIGSGLPALFTNIGLVSGGTAAESLAITAALATASTEGILGAGTAGIQIQGFAIQSQNITRDVTTGAPTAADEQAIGHFGW